MSTVLSPWSGPLPWLVLALGWASALALAWRSRRARVQAAGLALRLAAQQDETARSEHARSEAELRARMAEERYQLALRGSLDGMWEWQVQAQRVLLSPRWKGMLGFGVDGLGDALGSRRDEWLERLHPDDRAGFAAALDQVVTGEAPRLDRELRLVHRDGSVRHVLSRALLLRDEEGQPERVIGLDTDVTRIKRVQAILDEVADGTAGTHGEAFFAAMVQHFARALDVDCAFVTECADQPPTRVRTLACWSAHEGLQPNFEYDLAGTPCQEVVDEGRACFHPERLAEKFPREANWEAYVGLPIVASDGRVLGHLALLDKARLGDDVLVERVYRIFLARAAAEIERLQALARLALLGSAQGAATSVATGMAPGAA
jgi:PAS domain S-box-containing protein